MDAQRKKLILAVALLVVAAGVFFYFYRGSGDGLADSVRFVCVATGKSYSIARSKLPNAFPAPSPDTGERTLLPIEQRDGKTYVFHSYARLLRDPALAKVNKYVDPDSLEVLSVPRSQ